VLSCHRVLFTRYKVLQIRLRKQWKLIAIAISSGVIRELSQGAKLSWRGPTSQNSEKG